MDRFTGHLVDTTAVYETRHTQIIIRGARDVWTELLKTLIGKSQKVVQMMFPSDLISTSLSLLKIVVRGDDSLIIKWWYFDHLFVEQIERTPWLNTELSELKLDTELAVRVTRGFLAIN